MADVFAATIDDAAARALPEALRAATRDLHHRVDHHPHLAPLVRADLTTGQYVHALTALHGLFAPCEARLADYLGQHHPEFPYAPRRRLADLEADLAYWGQPRPAPAWGGPDLDSPAQAVGCLYVLEGSNLGGRVIYRQLQASLKIDRERGARFFHGHGEAAEAMWGGFWHFASRVCPPSAAPEAAAAAAGLFRTFLDQLDAS